MQIAYIWIKNFGPFVQQGFNFGGRFLYSFSEKSNELTISSNPRFIANFFNDGQNFPKVDTANIENVTAVIGENGSGKSLLMDFIKTNVVDGGGGVEYPCTVVMLDGKTIFVFHYSKNKPKLIYRDGIIERENGFEIGTDAYGFEFKSIESEDVITHSGRYIGVRQESIQATWDVDFVFLSNVFDGKYEVEHGNLRNISTNYLVREDSSESIVKKKLKSRRNDIEQHRIKEIERQIYFISDCLEHPGVLSSTSGHEIINLPQRILVKLKRRFFKKTSSKGEPLDLDENLDNLIKKVDGKFEFSKRGRTRKVDLFIAELFFWFLSEAMRRDDVSKSVASPLWSAWEEVVAQSDDFKTVMLQILNGIRNTLTDDDINNMMRFLKSLDDYVEDETNLEVDAFSIPVKPIQFLRKFIRSYHSSFKFEGGLEFDWAGMSSGEKSFLNIFSRLHFLSNNINKFSNKYLRKNVIILIDEIDLYLHPRWEQELLAKLIEFISKDYATALTEGAPKGAGERRNVQLLISSNKPIVVSDLPSSNVIFLRKLIGGQTEVVTDTSRLTFAANIHSLYADSFFLNEGLIGSFAKSKINKCIHWLNNSNDFENEEYYRKLIEIVDEPLVQMSLRRMLDKKYRKNR